MAQSLQEYYNQLAPIYEPQTALIKQQQAQIPQQYEAQKSALEQARINAFRDIANTASSRGMTFSGFRPQQEATYTGEKYLPALANLTTAQQTAQNSLTEALNKINAERSSTALSYYEGAQQAEAENAAKIQAAEIERQAKLEAAQIEAAYTAQKEQPSEQQAIATLGSSFKSGPGYARFYTGEGTYLTREQAAYQLAAALGISYEDALKKIYAQFKTAEGK